MEALLSLDWHPIVGIFAGILAATSIVPYVRDMLHGTTRPNKVTTLLWWLLIVIQASAQISAGASWSLIFTLVLAVNVSITTFLAFAGYGYTKHGPFDYVCFVLASISIIAWQHTSNPSTAIILAVLTSMLAAVPAIVKTYRYPDTEHVPAWALITASAFLAALSTTKYDVANLAIPLYQLVENAIILSLAWRGVWLLRLSKVTKSV